MIAVANVRNARCLLKAEQTYGAVADCAGISLLQIHILTDFCSGLSDSEALKRLKGAARFPTALEAGIWAKGLRQFRRHRAKATCQ